MLGQLLKSIHLRFAPARQAITRSTIALLLGCVLVSGCSYATASGRQQMAYARYVKKYSHKRVKQKTKFKKLKMPFTPPSPSTVTTGVNESPQSMNSSEGN